MPVLLSLTIQKSVERLVLPDTSPLFEEVCPATIYPPSEVCLIAEARYPRAPPKVFCHSMEPSLLSFIIQISQLPWYFVISPSLDSVYPATIYPPSVVCAMLYAISLLAPPIAFCH